jgi:hypothetical protein
LPELACSSQIKANQGIAGRSKEKVRYPELRVKIGLDIAFRVRNTKFCEQQRSHFGHSKTVFCNMVVRSSIRYPAEMAVFRKLTNGLYSSHDMDDIVPF